MSDRPTLDSADGAPAILEAVARATRAKAHDGAECPDNRVPAPADLAAWLPECPATERAEAAELLGALFGTTATWDVANHNGDVQPCALIDGPLQPGMAALRNPDGTYRPVYVEPTAAVHAAWCDADPQPLHPLAPLVDAWQRLAPVPAEWDNRDHPVLPGTMAGPDGGLRPLVVANDPRQLPLTLTGGAGEPPRQLWLGFEQPEPVLPLVAFDARGGVSMTSGAGAAREIHAVVNRVVESQRQTNRVRADGLVVVPAHRHVGQPSQGGARIGAFDLTHPRLAP